MEATKRAVAAIPKSGWRCMQCRRASDLATGRFSARSATATLAEAARPTSQETAARPAPTDALSVLESNQPASPTRSAAPRKASMMDIAEARARAKVQEVAQGKAEESYSVEYSGKDLERQMTRKFFAGDVYSPHDLGSVEMKKWHKWSPKPRTPLDIIDRMGIDFMREYKNINMMQEFVSSNGLILHAKKTGFRAKNQRNMARAVRRATGLGLIPKIYEHPEMLMRVRRNM